MKHTKKLIFTVLVVVIILVFLLSWHQKYHDGAERFVLDLPDKDKARDTLLFLNSMAVILIDFIKNKYIGRGVIDSDICNGICPKLSRLIRQYNITGFVENIPTPSDDSTSYTENKGVKMAMCIRQYPSGEIIDDRNLLVFVLIHEMAHILTAEPQHGPTFWENFKWLLNEAVECGIYIPEDYSKNHKTFCSIKVTDNPLFTEHVRMRLN